MDVHVPEAGDQERALGIDDAALRCGRGGVERSHGNNVIALEDHGLIGQFFSGRDIDDAEEWNRVTRTTGKRGLTSSEGRSGKRRVSCR